jgi:hypothetical protein
MEMLTARKEETDQLKLLTGPNVFNNKQTLSGNQGDWLTADN